MMMDIGHKKKMIIVEILILATASLLFIIPQLYSQIAQDQLPATGDLIHRRIVYFLTNFPNFQDAPPFTLSHSTLYHYVISYVNIITGLVGDTAFYGFSILNLLMLPLALLVAFVFVRRLAPRYGIFAALLILLNPLLLFPFFGHADQHLIYIFFSLFLFVILFFEPTIKTQMAAILLFGVLLNSSLAIWLPLAFMMLVLELAFPKWKILLLGACSMALYLPFLRPPLGYLLFGDYLVHPETLFKILILLGVGVLLLLLSYRYIQKLHTKQMGAFLIASVLTLFFLTSHQGGPYATNVRPLAKQAIQTSFEETSFINYIFSNNPSKHVDGFSLYIGVIMFLVILSLQTLKEKNWRFTTKEKILHAMIFIPFALALLRYMLLRVNFDYFLYTPIYNLHVGRLMSISLFLLPLSLSLYWPAIQRVLKPMGTKFLLSVMVIVIVMISQFYYVRVYPNWTQHTYQQAIHRALKQGIGDDLSPPEAEYARHFFQHDTLFGTSDIRR